MIGETYNNYKIIEPLGEGGMARVYIAEDTRDGSRVALKVSRESVPFSRESVSNEFDALRKLDHPSFPKSHDRFEIGERVALVMDLVEGEPAENLIDNLHQDLPAAVNFLKKAFAAMAHAGARGVIHADLKPENMLIKDDEVSIIDFGLATGATTLTAEDIKDIKGTLNYLSPEQAEGAPLDVRSDIFSMGVISYQALTGKLPFDSGYDMATLYAIMYEEPTPPSKVNTALGTKVDTFIATLLQKSPDDRFPDCASALTALEELEDNLTDDDKGGQVKITVVPFEFRGSADETDALAEGLTEELIVGLSKVEDIDVTPLSLIKRHGGSELTPERAKSEFGADFLLSGSVRRGGDQVRVTTSLIDTATTKLLWSDRHDTAFTDLFDVQDQISAAILRALHPYIRPEMAITETRRGTSSVEAYEYYLKARNYLTRNTTEDMDFARQMLDKAIEVDKEYPLAYAGMADLYGSLYMNFISHDNETWEKGVENAKKAIDLDPALPNGYRAHGRLLHLKGKYKEAIDTLIRAAALDASYGETYRTLAWACVGSGDLEQSLAWTRKALSLDAGNEETVLLKGILHTDLNEMPRAIDAFNRCLEMKPDYGRAHYLLARSYQRMGRFDEALEKYIPAAKFGGDYNIHLDYGWLLFGLGKREEGMRSIERACQEKEIEFVARFYLGYTKHLCGDEEGARKDYAIAREQSQSLLKGGDNSGYSLMTIAFTEAILDVEGLGEESYKECESFVEDNGELAFMMGRYCILREWKDEALNWIGRAICTRMGPSLDELLVDPMLEGIRADIENLRAKPKAA
ncbi:MAG: protein kinase [candidate division Zixibacteria bacterium]|nr:protein kinase [candidate division Zixibacteria bacterium]